MQYFAQKHSNQLSAMDKRISEVQTGLSGVQTGLKKLSGEVQAEFDKLSKEVITKTDLINLGEELGQHNPCLRNMKSVFRRYPK